jgi:hypothetical protein
MIKENTFFRKATLEDFLDGSETINQNNKHNKHNKNHSNDNDIKKNQQEFGHKKRIKP